MNLNKRKKRLIGIFVFLTFLLIGVIIVIYKREENPYWYQKYRRDIGLAYLKSGKKHIYKSGSRISPSFDWVNTPRFETTSPLLVFSKNNLRGYFNLDSEKVQIKPKFKHAWIFDEHYKLAAVQEPNSGLIGFITEHGSYQISPRYPHDRAIYEKDHFVFDGEIAIVPLSDTALELGLIDSTGFILCRGFDDIKVSSFKHTGVCLEGKKGLVNDAGVVVLPIEYDHLLCNSSGIVVRKSIQQQLLAYDYKTILSNYVFDDIRPLYNFKYNYEFTYDDNTFGKGVSGRYGVFIINGKSDLLDLKTNKVLIDAVWDKLYYIIPDQYILAEREEMAFLLDEQGKELKFN